MKRSKEFPKHDPAKREPEAVSRLPHTEASREEEERLNPERYVAKGKGHREPYKKIEEFADTRMNPEEELIAKEEGGTEENDLRAQSIEDANEKEQTEETSEFMRQSYERDDEAQTDGQGVSGSKLSENEENWRVEKLHGQENEKEVNELSNMFPNRFEEVTPEKLAQQPKQEKVTHNAFGWDTRKMGKTSKRRGKEKRKKESPKGKETIRKSKTVLDEE